MKFVHIKTKRVNCNFCYLESFKKYFLSSGFPVQTLFANLKLPPFIISPHSCHHSTKTAAPCLYSALLYVCHLQCTRGVLQVYQGCTRVIAAVGGYMSPWFATSALSVTAVITLSVYNQPGSSKGGSRSSGSVLWVLLILKTLTLPFLTQR